MKKVHDPYVVLSQEVKVSRIVFIGTLYNNSIVVVTSYPLT